MLGASKVSGRPAVVLLGVALAIATAAALAVALLGREGDGAPLAWSEGPRLATPAGLPDDRVLSGRIRNDSLRPLRIEAREVRLETEDGEPVEGAATFAAGFVHGLYPPMRGPRSLSDAELERTGRIALLEPGEDSPVTLSWRRENDSPPPARARFGDVALALPE